MAWSGNTPPPPVICILSLVRDVLLHGDADKPFVVGCTVQCLCEQVSRVFDTRDVVDVDESRVYSVADKMCTDVNMLHVGVGVWILYACDGALVVAVEWGGIELRKSEFIEKRS